MKGCRWRVPCIGTGTGKPTDIDSRTVDSRAWRRGIGGIVNSYWVSFWGDEMFWN